MGFFTKFTILAFAASLSRAAQFCDDTWNVGIGQVQNHGSTNECMLSHVPILHSIRLLTSTGRIYNGDCSVKHTISMDQGVNPCTEGHFSCDPNLNIGILTLQSECPSCQYECSLPNQGANCGGDALSVCVRILLFPRCPTANSFSVSAGSLLRPVHPSEDLVCLILRDCLLDVGNSMVNENLM
jgi:hypothetical protein